MGRKYFGTDGIRGRVGQAPITPEFVEKVIEKERPVTQFTIQASFQRADSAYIRTVPLSQSVR